MRQWAAQIPDFPQSKEEYDEMATRPWYQLFPPPPLVPYDVKGIDRKVKNIIYIYK